MTNMYYIILIPLSTVLACSTHTLPGAKAVAEEFGEPYQGFRSSPPDISKNGERLDIFLGVPEVLKEEDERPLDSPREFDEVVYCIAQNKNKEPLPEVHTLISSSPPDKLIYLWGVPMRKKRQWWWDGVTCVAQAIAVWHPKANRYIYFDLTYSIPIWQWTTIRRSLKIIVEKGVKSAL